MVQVQNGVLYLRYRDMHNNYYVYMIPEVQFCILIFIAIQKKI